MTNIKYKITHGVYVVTTQEGGCIVDAVSQVSGGEEPLISIAINKGNYTNELVKKNKKLILSVVSESDNGELIRNFGHQSMRDVNKFANGEYNEVDGIKVPKNVIGYLECSLVDTIDTETHDLFIVRAIDGDMYKDEKPMTYAYYQEHKDELVKVETEKGKRAYVCTICGYVYYGDELPSDFICPRCGVDASLFKLAD